MEFLTWLNLAITEEKLINDELIEAKPPCPCALLSRIQSFAVGAISKVVLN